MLCAQVQCVGSDSLWMNHVDHALRWLVSGQPIRCLNGVTPDLFVDYYERRSTPTPCASPLLPMLNPHWLNAEPWRQGGRIIIIPMTLPNLIVVRLPSPCRSCNTKLQSRARHDLPTNSRLFSLGFDLALFSSECD
jgi:hypothetical protein